MNHSLTSDRGGKLRQYAQKITLGSLALWCCLGMIFSPIALATGAVEIPLLDPTRPTWVLDQADVISPLSQNKLDKTLSSLANQTGEQVRMVTIRRLDYGETPESFANKLFERWFPNPEAQANQVLVVLDTVTNGTAIRHGAEAQLPAEIATSVAQETMRVPLREGNYNQSLLDAADRLSAVLEGKPDPGPPEIKIATTESTFKSAEETDGKSATLVVVGLLLAATIIPMVTYFIYQGSS